MELGSLFLSAFLASTLLPGGSEAVLWWAVSNDNSPWWLLLLVATAGNTLGGMTSWVIGRVLPTGKERSPKVEAAIKRVRQYGPLVLLLSWVPIIGDPLCVAAGWVRIRWWMALVPIAIGKAARYGVLLVLAA